MAYELYQTLEVPPDASAEDIRRAYYRMVRKHPPEKDPERFQLIREAYETLSDEKLRRDYDALQQHGDEISGLFNQAIQLMEEGRWETAACRLKDVLVLSPGNRTALHTLGVCFLHAEKFQKATEVYQDLVEDHPKVALYQFNLGISYFELAEADRGPESAEALTPQQEDWYREARRHFVTAVELEPHNPDHYIAVARTFVEQGDFRQGLQWAERATSARGTTDHYDFESLFWICLFHLRRADLGAVEKAAARIAALLPEDPEVHRYAAFRFARVGIDLYESKAIEPAVKFFEIACGFDPDDPDLQHTFTGATNTLETCNAFDRMMEDTAILPPLKRLTAVCMALFFEERIENFDQVMEEVFSELDVYSFEDILASLRKLQADYPRIVEINPTMFADMERIAEREMAAGGEEAAGGVSSRRKARPSGATHPAARLLAWILGLLRK